MHRYEGSRKNFCKLCAKQFQASGPGTWSYCSNECRKKVSTAQHARYVAKNRAHIRDYVRERKQRIWGKSDRLIAIEAEKLAVSRILPGLGFSEISHLSNLNSFFPFDIVATFHGEKVLVEVTTGMAKTLSRQRIIANALGMSIIVLFISPDLRLFFLSSKVESNYVAFRRGEIRRIA